MYDCILFDLDGTLTDSFDGITNSVFYALKKMGEPLPDKRELYPFIGPPLSESFGARFDGDMKKAERAVAFYREYYSTNGWAQNRVYDGVEDMLALLKAAGKRLLIATSKPEHFSKRIAEHFGLNKYIEHVYGASFDSSRDTKDKVIAYALNSIGADKKSVVMIGDRKHDVLGAKENGIESIGVLYGYGSREELETAGADFIAATPKDIIDLV